MRKRYVVQMIHSCLQYYVIHLSSGSSYISKLKTGNFFIIPTGVLHRYAADERSPWTIYWVHFKGINTKLMINNFLSRKESYCAYVEYRKAGSGYLKECIPILKWDIVVIN